jgi:predicted DNA-binding transcriptional regulator AlpA
MATFLRLPALAARLGISIRTIHGRFRTDPHFPQPVKLGTAPQSPLGFVVAEVEMYEARLMAARHDATTPKKTQTAQAA